MKRYLSIIALGLFCWGGERALGDQKREPVFQELGPMGVQDAQAKALDWLRSVGKTDAQTMSRFEAIWAQPDHIVLDMLAETLTLGDPAAAKLLADARDPNVAAPIKVPAILRDTKAPLFFRANLALAYARALSNRRVHEESLAVLTSFRPEQVVDPAAYLFHRSVAEHALLSKTEATQSISRLLEDCLASAERYKTVAALMLLDMQTWKDKDLGAVARQMENIERRLDLARGGPQTQKLQKEVIARLDEIIKELENKCKGCCNGNGGGCPNGGSGSGGGNNASAPMQDSNIVTAGGPGRVDQIKMKRLVQEWGRMPPREQARALQDLTQGMSARHREAIENYFRNLALASTKR